MARLIDADALIAQLKCDTKDCDKCPAHDYWFGCGKVKEFIDNAPTIDSVPVRHGIWIEYGENKDGTHNILCSVCDGFLKSKGHANSCYTRNKYRYCHNCGARMDGGED